MRYVLSVGWAALLLGPAWGGERPEDLLGRAFPDDETRRAPIKIHWRAQGVLVAAATAEVLADGRVRLTGLAFAQFPPGEDGRAVPTTARSPRATLTLDGPVRQVADLAGRKLASIELDSGTRLEVGAR